MEEAGLVSTRWETMPRRVPREYYRLTGEGRERLDRLRDEWEAFHRAINQLLEEEKP